MDERTDGWHLIYLCAIVFREFPTDESLRRRMRLEFATCRRAIMRLSFVLLGTTRRARDVIYSGVYLNNRTRYLLQMSFLIALTSEANFVLIALQCYDSHLGSRTGILSSTTANRLRVIRSIEDKI